MASLKKKGLVLYGDLVELRHVSGRLPCRVYGRTPPQRTRSAINPSVYLLRHKYVVKASPSYDEDIRSVLELATYVPPDIPELDWGRIPERPWLLVPGEKLKEALSETDRENFARAGLCPRCGSQGTWVSMALVCDFHGRFVG